MPSTIALGLCFFAFVCGQVFQAAIHPSSIVKAAPVPEAVVVARGYSFATLVFVVVAVLLIHDGILILLLHGLAKADVETKSARLASNILKAALDNAPGFRRPTLLLLPPVPVNDPRPSPHSILVGPPRTIWVLPFLKMHRVGVLLIPRPFWTRAIYRQAVCALGPRAALPIQHPPVLALAPKHSTASIVSCPQDGVLLFRCPLEDLTAGGFSLADEDTDIQTIDASSTAEKENVEGEERKSHDIDLAEPNAPESDHEIFLDDSPLQARPSRAPFLRYVAASALLRRLQFRAVDEACYASIEEVKEDDTTKVEEDFEEDIEGEYVGEEVKGVMDEEDVKKNAIEEDTEENVEEHPINVEQVVKKNVKEDIEEEVKIVEETVLNGEDDDIEKDAQRTVQNVEDTAEVPETVEEDVKTVERAEEDAEVEEAAQITDPAQDENEIAGKVPVQPAPEVDEETKTHSVDGMKMKEEEEEEVEDAASEDRVGPDYDYDDLPSYEDFVRDLPNDPLFEEWATAAPAYAITRPPPLAALVACTTTTTRDARTRGSHIALLGRLSSRVSASA
ncbi:hypothetical protein C8R47DRAFT_1327787 [Mycena vitilis]|nr:hypothetical protein C8R47DRAFT_1327787 [Mycena vitilis]